MPGHIKLVKGAVDPDPTEFLLPSIEMKRADQAFLLQQHGVLPCEPLDKGEGVAK